MVGVTAGYVIAVRALIHFLRVDTQGKPVKYSQFSRAFRVEYCLPNATISPQDNVSQILLCPRTVFSAPEAPST